MEKTHSGAGEKCENREDAERKLLHTEGSIPPFSIPPIAAWEGLGSEVGHEKGGRKGIVLIFAFCFSPV